MLLTNSAASTAALASAGSLPANDPSNGEPFLLSTAQEKAFGLIPANGAAIDGHVGFLKGYSDYVGTALHEITHALGRLSSLFRL